MATAAPLQRRYQHIALADGRFTLSTTSQAWPLLASFQAGSGISPANSLICARPVGAPSPKARAVSESQLSFHSYRALPT
jgi:hypothetical protein